MWHWFINTINPYHMSLLWFAGIDFILACFMFSIIVIYKGLQILRDLLIMDSTSDEIKRGN